jgi:ATP-dependent DNA helicase RecG
VTNENELPAILAVGESATLEFKKSTAELRRVGETLCSFLNGDGGRVLIGITPDGKPIGQTVLDKNDKGPR